ncbi:hypothetical protein HDV00_000921 [Rhizophlyctis rosea]|nr:hypothetical protein HDV00_000921 [Rhizophlyctis rosea]
MDHLTEYERQRLENIRRNQQVLIDLGLSKPIPASTAQKRKAADHAHSAKRQKQTKQQEKKKEKGSKSGVEGGAEEDYEAMGLRRSRRVRAQTVKDTKNAQEDLPSLDNSISDDDLPFKPRRTKKIGPTPTENVFGSIPGIEVGKWWPTRMACCYDRIHRPPVSGIHGSEEEGCYSLALSGGYEDDIDFGEAFTYTGEGGRDLKGTKANPKNLRTAPQSKDQVNASVLERGNKALYVSSQTGNPVRVVRGYKCGEFAPAEGYRYDGLYKVEKAWTDTGLSGYQVWKFALVRLPGQGPFPPPPADQDAAPSEGEDGTDSDTQNEIVLAKED